MKRKKTTAKISIVGDGQKINLLQQDLWQLGAERNDTIEVVYVEDGILLKKKLGELRYE